MCECSKETYFRGNQVREKLTRDPLNRIKRGPKFGDVLYRCQDCGQLWEENLSEASNKDWPPILVKVSREEMIQKHGGNLE